MITWFQLWPVLLMPSAILSALAAIPTLQVGGRLLGGGPVREFYLNHFVLPLLPGNTAAALVGWFSSASAFHEWLLALAVSINFNALLLPLLYVLGVFIIRLSAWASKKDIQLKRESVR